jgi:hypothetical protein
MSRLWLLPLLISFLAMPADSGATSLSSREYQMITKAFYSPEAGLYQDLEDSYMVFRIELSKSVHLVDEGTVVPLRRGEALPEDEYGFKILNWSMYIVGPASYLGSMKGNEGSFDWFLEYSMGQAGWLDLWANANGSNGENISMPGFGWTMNYADPWADDYMKIRSAIFASGSFATDQGYVSFDGSFQPVPEPSTWVLLACGMMAVAAYMRPKVSFRTKR